MRAETGNLRKLEDMDMRFTPRADQVLGIPDRRQAQKHHDVSLLPQGLQRPNDFQLLQGPAPSISQRSRMKGIGRHRRCVGPSARQLPAPAPFHEPSRDHRPQQLEAVHAPEGSVEKKAKRRYNIQLKFVESLHALAFAQLGLRRFIEMPARGVSDGVIRLTDC